MCHASPSQSSASMNAPAVCSSSLPMHYCSLHGSSRRIGQYSWLWRIVPVTVEPVKDKSQSSTPLTAPLEFGLILLNQKIVTQADCANYTMLSSSKNKTLADRCSFAAENAHHHRESLHWHLWIDPIFLFGAMQLNKGANSSAASHSVGTASSRPSCWVSKLHCITNETQESTALPCSQDYLVLRPFWVSGWEAIGDMIA